jgi:hypothetical protein
LLRVIRERKHFRYLQLQVNLLVRLRNLEFTNYGFTVSRPSGTLAARKLAQWHKPSAAVDSAIADTITTAERVMRTIDEMYPERT